MGSEVRLTQGAEQDLEDIYDDIVDHDGVENADHVLDRLLQTTDNLSIFPEGGSHPKKLLAVGIREYRQAPFKPYRLIYRVVSNQVVVYLIADGRRNLQSLLERRLLRSSAS